jgi:hypothetical protein
LSLVWGQLTPNFSLPYSASFIEGGGEKINEMFTITCGSKWEKNPHFEPLGIKPIPIFLKNPH